MKDSLKFQVSGFKNGRSKQYVFRTNDKVEFIELDKWLDELIEEEKDPLKEWGHYCGTCGEKQEFKQGISEKGRKWAGYFCIKNDKHPPSWREYEGK